MFDLSVFSVHFLHKMESSINKQTLKALFSTCKSSDAVLKLFKALRTLPGTLDAAVDRLTDLDRAERVETENDQLEKLYTLEEIRPFTNKKFRLSGGDFRVRIRPFDYNDLEQLLGLLSQIFNLLFKELTSQAKKNDLVRIVFSSEQLEYPISIRTTRKSEFSAEMFFDEVSRVLQSYQKFDLSVPVFVNVVHIEIPGGGGFRRKHVDATQFIANKACIITISSYDQLCFARSVIIAKAHADGLSRTNKLKWAALIRQDSTLQTNLASDLHQRAGFREGVVGLDQIHFFLSVLPGYQIIVYDKPYADSIVYQSVSAPKHLTLLLCNGHYSVVKSLVPFLGQKRCDLCNDVSSTATKHKCRKRCFVCNEDSCLKTAPTYCTQCQRFFNNDKCYKSHLRLNKKNINFCTTYRQCFKCNTMCNMAKKRLDKIHHCGEYFCRNCRCLVASEHRCYIKIYDEKPKKKPKMLYCDFECDFSSGVHCPIAAVAIDDDGIVQRFFGKNTQEKFCAWLFHERHRNHIVLFHNMSSYDGMFLLQYLERNMVRPAVIMKGLKILHIRVKELGLSVKDSLCFIQLKLDQFPKALDFAEISKGTFPFLFMRPENYEYDGEIPDIKFYDPDGMTAGKLAEFSQWYSTERAQKKRWKFFPELLSYCEMDCVILRRGIQKFSQLMESMTGYCPVTESITIASFVNLMYRAKYMPLNSIALLPKTVYSQQRNTSHEALEWLFYRSRLENRTIRHAMNDMKGEAKVYGKRVDGLFTDPFSGKMTVYEYQGCPFHGCPTCFEPGSRNFEGTRMKDLLERTKRKNSFLRSKNVQVEEIYSCEFRKLKSSDDTCKQILKNFTSPPPLNPRDALRGGRVECFKLLATGDDKRKICYADCNSLYPAVCKQELYPIGAPIIHRDLEGTTIDSYFGLVHLTILPPRGLDYPILPIRIGGNMHFTLCAECSIQKKSGGCPHVDTQRAITGVYTTPEIQYAVTSGYKIMKIHEVWTYQEKGTQLFDRFITHFMRIKVRSSGWPKSCTSIESKHTYLEQLRQNDDITLNEWEIEDNPAMRFLGKMLVNVLWGKLAVRPNLPKYEYITSEQRFKRLVFSGHEEVEWLHPVDSNTLAVQYRHLDEYGHQDINSSVVVAAFVTSYGRIRLHKMMTAIGRELIYVDTDSVFYHQHEQKLPNIGPYLGQFKDELDGEYITFFVAAGPKMYAYVTNTGKEEYRAKGITMNQRTCKLFNVETLKELVANPLLTGHVYNPYKIFRVKGSWALHTKSQIMDCIKFNLGLAHPFNLIISAPSQGGKTQWLTRLLCGRKISPFPKQIILVYQHACAVYYFLQTVIDGVQLIKKLPEDIEGFIEKLPRVPTLLIVDDSMGEVDKSLMRLFIRGRHLDLSVILVVHNLFFKSDFTRTIFLNCHYVVLFRNPTDSLQVETVGRRMFPRKSRLFVEAFELATSRPYGYLLIDAKSLTPESLRLRSALFGETRDTYPRVYGISDKMQEYVLVPALVFEELAKRVDQAQDAERKRLNDTKVNLAFNTSDVSQKVLKRNKD